MKEKKTKIESKKKKNEFKQMTIRYNLEQEKQILEMQEKIGEKTMSKAFLKAPIIFKNMKARIDELEEINIVQKSKMHTMAKIIDSWASFNNRLEEFLKMRETSTDENKETDENDDEDFFEEEDEKKDKTLAEYGIRLED